MSALPAALKWLHVVGASFLLGGGLVIAFNLWLALRGRDPAAIATAARATVIADFVFTLPAIVLQPVTGVALAASTGYPLGSRWIVASLALYLVAGACWIPVVFIQRRMRALAEHSAREGRALTDEFHGLARRWFLLGWPAFAAVATVYWLMIARPA